MTLDEWIAFYNRKNPQDPFVPTEGFSLQFREDKGFCEVAFSEEYVLVGQVAGDARFFKQRIEEAARKLGIHKGWTICVRPAIRAYIRLFGGKIERVEKDERGKEHFYIDVRGKPCTIQPAWTYDETGRDACYVEWQF